MSNSDQELARGKHHKKHYEEKRKSHLDMIEGLKRDLNVKEQELQVTEYIHAFPYTQADGCGID